MKTREMDELLKNFCCDGIIRSPYNVALVKSIAGSSSILEDVEYQIGMTTCTTRIVKEICFCHEIALLCFQQDDPIVAFVTYIGEQMGSVMDEVLFDSLAIHAPHSVDAGGRMISKQIVKTMLQQSRGRDRRRLRLFMSTTLAESYVALLNSRAVDPVQYAAVCDGLQYAGYHIKPLSIVRDDMIVLANMDYVKPFFHPDIHVVWSGARTMSVRLMVNPFCTFNGDIVRGYNMCPWSEDC